MMTAKDLAELPGRSESTKLKTLYDTLNQKYFGGALPGTRPPFSTSTIYFLIWLMRWATRERITFGGWIIGIDQRLQEFENILEILLLHEMIYVELGTDSHGSEFRERFRMLVSVGAFDTPFIGVD
jgi:hypothetical protein